MTEKEHEHLTWMVGTYGALLTNVIQITTLTEKTVNFCIAHLLCSNQEERKTIVELLISPLTFNSKSKLLTKLLKNKRPELNTKYSEVIDEMDRLYKFRNTLAHSHLETTDEQIRKLDKSKIPYTNPIVPQIMFLSIKDSDEKYYRLKYVNEQMITLYKEIKKPIIP